MASFEILLDAALRGIFYLLAMLISIQEKPLLCKKKTIAKPLFSPNSAGCVGFICKLQQPNGYVPPNHSQSLPPQAHRANRGVPCGLLGEIYSRSPCSISRCQVVFARSGWGFSPAA